MAVAGGADVAGVEQDFLVVILEHGLALDDVIKFRLMLVVMIADGAAGVHGDVGEHTAVAVQALLVGQVLDVDEALAVLDAGVHPGTVFRQCVHGIVLLVVPCLQAGGGAVKVALLYQTGGGKSRVTALRKIAACSTIK